MALSEKVQAHGDHPYVLYRRNFQHAHFIPIVGVEKRGEKSTFNDYQQTQLRDLCTKYRSVFRYPRKNSVNVLLLKHNLPCRNTLSQ